MKEFMNSDNATERLSLMKKRAEWAHNANDPHAAAEMYLSAGQVDKAIEIAAANKWTPMLVDISRKLDANEAVQHLRLISDHLKRIGAVAQACDVLRKIGDQKTLVELLVESAAWNEALSIAKEKPEVTENLRQCLTFFLTKFLGLGYRRDSWCICRTRDGWRNKRNSSKPSEPSAWPVAARSPNACS